MCVCVYVGEREREGEIGREGERESARARARERERGVERESAGLNGTAPAQQGAALAVEAPLDSGLVASTGGRGATRAEDAQGTPTQSHIAPSIRVHEDIQT